MTTWMPPSQPRSRPPGRLDARDGIVLAGAIVAALLAGCSSQRLEQVKAFQGTRTVRPAVVFHILRDNPDIGIIDLRNAEEFHGPLGHVRGAVNVPLERLDDLLAVTAGLAGDRALLVYCRDQACTDDGAVRLRAQGIRFLFLLEGGIEAWVEGGFGTVGQAAPGPTCDQHSRPIER